MKPLSVWPHLHCVNQDFDCDTVQLTHVVCVSLCTALQLLSSRDKPAVDWRAYIAGLPHMSHLAAAIRRRTINVSADQRPYSEIRGSVRLWVPLSNECELSMSGSTNPFTANCLLIIHRRIPTSIRRFCNMTIRANCARIKFFSKGIL